MALENNMSEKYALLPAHLSDAGKYSYCTMCAIALHDLYNNEWDRSFTENCLDKLIIHLELPNSVKPVMSSLLSGEYTQSWDPCLEVLKKEKAVASNCSAILYDFILLAVKEGLRCGTYDARWRVLVQHLADNLGIPSDTIEQYEMSVITCLTRTPGHAEADTSRGKTSNKFRRYALVGLAGLGGGALIGLTGGLAAPFIGAGIASLGLGGVVGGGAAMLSTAAGVAVVGSLFGAAGAGLTGYKMHKRVGEIEEFEFDRLDVEQMDNNNEPPEVPETITRCQQLHISIVISGWLKDEGADSYVKPWMCVRASQEQYYLRYESKYLLQFGRAIEYILSLAFSIATQEVLKYTALSGLLSAITWPGALLGLANMIDNPWSVCCGRAAQVGRQLAHVLLAREQGSRPVTLVGFSIGARVIYYCLAEMAERGNCEGIIQDAILIGAPCSGNAEYWKKFTRVVAGRLVNGYCKNDWLLKFLYRTLSMPSHGVAGLHPIELDDRRMVNVDLTDIVAGHSEYPDKICLILRQMKVRVKDGPCGEVKERVPRVQTMDDIPPTKSVLSPLALRRTQSDNVLTKLSLEDTSSDDSKPS
ncbi:transmembrane and coiled-coil domain-containing protein 4-like isoform X1 [Macrosteles quadrilineatus]|uniref:transmembrane and coiled-coil domain-containing protein 4-like isoform X1 n=1 Tax=Macrosteles quadrilineatus TaxID=74068 RepID=UPI0023E3179B|nr:transmembrane and coiled-coil domain-containing protein 4-like isoform X1 [Macrosteles quadrilineatus]